MSPISPNSLPTRFGKSATLEPLEAGEHLDQKTFHARYAAMPPGTRAESIGGRVFRPSPVRTKHGSPHIVVSTWLGTYQAHTPGTQAVDNTTSILGDDSEPQPDAAIRILHGGQTTTSDGDYIVGCPELVCEVASSSTSYDLHEKLADYDKYGAKEYVVALVRPADVKWPAATRPGRLTEVSADADGLYRSTAFPGLWLDPVALVRGDAKRVLEVLTTGLATAEHAAFVTEMAGRGGV